MNLPKRKNNRLDNYDYGEIGCYFVTMCTQGRKRLFEIESVGNDLCVVPCVQNQIIHKWIIATQNKYPNIKFEKYVIMPDHIHFIANITERHAGRSLHDAVRYFKTMTTNDYIKGVKNSGLQRFDKKLWQKSYYDHIIRNQSDYNEIFEYIENNPKKWIIMHKESGE